jgi:superfamily II DNA or RNA helicase
MQQMTLVRPYNNLRLRALRPRQTQCVADIRQAIKEGHKRIIVAAPCGFGKTLLSAHLIGGALAKGTRPLFTAPAISLIDQTVKAFEFEGIRDIGVIQAQHVMTNREAQVQIASVQTLVKRELPDVDFLMLDEAHRSYKGLNEMIDGAWKDKLAIGLTATPWVKGMGLRWTKLIIPATISQLIAEELLTPTTLYIPEQIADRGNIAVEKGEFTEASSSAEMRQQRIVGNVVDTWKKLGPGEKTFMFCVNLDHARAQMAAFIDSGIPFGYIDAQTPLDDRTLQFKKMQYGEIAGIASVGCLIAGIDEDVRCLIDAAPTKSEISLVQRWGRGIRTADGKTCIARDSLVLTQHGLIKIQDITLDHMVWDGVSFVHHKGSICRGIKDVIEHDGIIGTPDHEVMTDDGFQELADAKRRQKRIATTGIGGTPIWFAGDNIQKNEWYGEFSVEGRGEVFKVRWNSHGTFLQHEEEAGDSGLSSLQRKARESQDGNTALAIREMRIGKVKMSESPEYRLSFLRWEGNQIPLRWIKRGCSVDCGEFRDSGQIIRDRQDKQLRALRAGESSLGFEIQTDEQHEDFRWNETTEDNRIPHKLPSRPLCRQHIGSPYVLVFGRRDFEALGDAEFETQREVWDILSAGPLQRFTVNGKLVHNCLIGLDHAGNNSDQGLGLFWEIFHDHLDTHKPHEKGVAYESEKRPAKPRKCSVCNALIPAGSAVCKNCGEAIHATGIEHEDGKLVVYGTPPAEKATKREYTMQEKQEFYSGMLWIVRERGNSEGAAAHRYREKFGVWPSKLLKVARPPSFEIEQFDRHCRIKFAKSKAKGGAGAQV